MGAAEPLNTHGVTMQFGKHKGELITRVPLGYLRFMINNATPQSDLARAELERRGGDLPSVHISGHAVDRASLRVRKIWHETRDKDEGLHSWLCRMVGEAIDANGGAAETTIHKGMKLVIEPGEEYPSLKTIMRAKTPSPGRAEEHTNSDPEEGQPR